MSIERDDEGNEWYPEPEPLTKEEHAWLRDNGLGGYVGELTNIVQPGKVALFQRLWGSGNPFEHQHHQCKVCGAYEGHCLNTTCIRTRITNKLHLHA